MYKWKEGRVEQRLKCKQQSEWVEYRICIFGWIPIKKVENLTPVAVWSEAQSTVIGVVPQNGGAMKKIKRNLGRKLFAFISKLPAHPENCIIGVPALYFIRTTVCLNNERIRVLYKQYLHTREKGQAQERFVYIKRQKFGFDLFRIFLHFYFRHFGRWTPCMCTHVCVCVIVAPSSSQLWRNFPYSTFNFPMCKQTEGVKMVVGAVKAWH